MFVNVNYMVINKYCLYTAAEMTQYWAQFKKNDLQNRAIREILAEFYRIAPSFLENSLYLFPYMYKCLYQFPTTYKQILIHRCEIFVILFIGAQDVTKIDLILLKKGNKTTDIELSLKIIHSSNTTTTDMVHTWVGQKLLKSNKSKSNWPWPIVRSKHCI